MSVEVQRLKQALTETQQQLRETEQELAQLESVGRGAVDKILALEEAVANLKASKTTQKREYAEELQASRDTLVDAEVTIEILKQCLESRSVAQHTNPSVTRAPTHREEAAFSADKTNSVDSDQRNNSADLKDVKLQYLEPPTSNGDSRQHKLEFMRQEVEELRKQTTNLEASLVVANGKLVFMREMVLSVAPTQGSIIVDEK